MLSGVEVWSLFNMWSELQSFDKPGVALMHIGGLILDIYYHIFTVGLM